MSKAKSKAPKEFEPDLNTLIARSSIEKYLSKFKGDP